MCVVAHMLTFDRITSVGMFEHVGIAHLPGYFAKINSLLAEDGIAMIHGITSTDAESGETPYGNGEFIEKQVARMPSIRIEPYFIFIR